MTSLQYVVYKKFLEGLDTADISKEMKLHECDVLRMVNKERSLNRGLPIPYTSEIDKRLYVRRSPRRPSVAAG